MVVDLYQGKRWAGKKKKKLVPPVRLELTTFRLWDWRAADCAKEARDRYERLISKFIVHVQAARPSLDLFKAIFAESSDKSVVSSDESDVESTVTSSHKNPSNTTEVESTNQSGSRWQDLSTVTNHSINTEIVSLPPPTLNQGSDNEKLSDSAENSRPPDQPVECYGPSLPPSKHSI